MTSTGMLFGSAARGALRRQLAVRPVRCTLDTLAFIRLLLTGKRLSGLAGRESVSSTAKLIRLAGTLLCIVLAASRGPCLWDRCVPLESRADASDSNAGERPTRGDWFL